MNKGSSYLLIGLMLAALARPGHAQPPPGPPEPPPAFCGGPPPGPAPEFCPAPQAPQRMSTVPFDNLCPLGNAFSCPCPPDASQPRWYFGLGGIFLRPLQLDRGTVAVIGPFNAGAGTVPPADAPVAVDFTDVPNPFMGGVRGTLGFNFGPNAVEISGFYLAPRTTTATASAQGQIDVAFGNVAPPTGFTTGGGNVFLQADRVDVTRRVELANLEGNYRYCYTKGIEFLIGFRYLDYRDRIDIFTDDAVLALGGVPNPVAQATYAVDAHNRILVPQVGFELEQILVPIVAAGLEAKAGVGPNFLSVRQSLTRGDGFQGPGGSDNRATFSGVVDVTPYIYFWFNDNFRLRLGYEVLWLAHIAEAQSQINFNPNIPLTESNNTGNQIFHGPLFEFQVAF